MHKCGHDISRGTMSMDKSTCHYVMTLEESIINPYNHNHILRMLAFVKRKLFFFFFSQLSLFMGAEFGSHGWRNFHCFAITE